MDQSVVNLIKTSQQQGVSKENIYKQLLSQGNSIDTIEQAFQSINSGNEKEDTQKKTIGIIVTIAAVLVGAGIFSFIASNWQEMGQTFKLFVIIFAMLISYALGWYLKEIKHLQKSGEALIVLGAIIYGAGIFLIAQMFHIRANWPDGFILWMIGVLALAFATESFVLFYVSIPLGIIALFAHPFGIISSFRGNPFLLTSTSLLMVATLVTFVTGFVMHKKIPKEDHL